VSKKQKKTNHNKNHTKGGGGEVVGRCQNYIITTLVGLQSTSKLPRGPLRGSTRNRAKVGQYFWATDRSGQLWQARGRNHPSGEWVLAASRFGREGKLERRGAPWGWGWGGGGVEVFGGLGFFWGGVVGGVNCRHCHRKRHGGKKKLQEKKCSGLVKTSYAAQAENDGS